MKSNPMRLPWSLETVPHAILDILRGCNIRCRDCYNLRPDRIKPMAEIEAHLDALMRLRKLQSVSIVGGEVILHPQLVEIVRRVRQRGLFVELFTNGAGLTEDLLRELKSAGASVIFLHIEPHQRRPDLPADATDEELRNLRSEKASLIASHGIEVGLAVTAYPDKLAEVEEAIAFCLDSPLVCYLLVTWWRDVGRMQAINGDLTGGMLSDPATDEPSSRERELRPDELRQWLQHRFDLTPFAYVGSNIDPADPRWLSFMVAAVHEKNAAVRRHSLRPTWMERAFMEVSRTVKGRYPFYQRQHPWQIGLHLLLNGLAGGGLLKNLNLIGHAVRHGGRLSAKRLLFQWPAAIDKAGRVVHCDCCPDAVLSEGRLVPLCLSDLVTYRQPAGVKERRILAEV
jgi:MoaA/NifB/PqqE/SkfB family radical SAM enzyme